jgi:hypothetical protein
MRPARTRVSAVVTALVLAVLCAIFGRESAEGKLHWQQDDKKEQIHVRLVALAWRHQRSSFFANEEIFLAEKELTLGESRLVKLVYGFLPYQPRLSEIGFDYSRIHQMRATRDPSCDEPLSQITSRGKTETPEEDVAAHPSEENGLKYSNDAPDLDVPQHHRRNPLPCYLTSADDYTKSVQQPVNEEDR